MNTKDNAIDWIKKEEGFCSKPYNDILGVSTIGYGFTEIERDEAEAVLKIKVDKLYSKLIAYLVKEEITLDEYRTSVLLDMMFQLGFWGTLAFKKMWKAIKNMDYDEASKQMLDSKWHQQTPERCELQAKRMKNGY